MKRKIYIVIKFSSNSISLVALEKKEQDLIEFYSKIEHTSNKEVMKNFIINTIQDIETAIKGKITKVFVQIDDDPLLNLQIHLNGIKKTILNENKEITKNDIKTALLSIKENYIFDVEATIFAQPISYMVSYEGKKINYLTPPINKKADEVEISCSTITINNKIHKSLIKFLEEVNIQVLDILITSNVLPYLMASSEQTQNGLINININRNNSTLTIVKNNALIKYNLFNIGLNDLINSIQQKFDLGREFIHKILKLYQIKNGISGNINSKIISTSNITYKDLQELMKEFTTKLFEKVKITIDEKELKTFPIYISGKIITDFIEKNAKKILNSSNIFLYKNKLNNFVSLSNLGLEARGAVKYIDQLDNSIDYKTYDTLIDTAPIDIKNLLLIEKKSFWKKIFKKK